MHTKFIVWLLSTLKNDVIALEVRQNPEDSG